jgi:hypothetical protein
VAVAIAAAALIFPLAGISGAPSGHPWKASFPFSEAVFAPSTQVNVSLTGTEKLTILVTGNDVLGWHEAVTAKLSHAIGKDSLGRTYRAKGSYSLTVQTPPGPPTIPTTFPASFVLHPPSPCKANHPPGPCFNPSSVLVPVTVTLNADGSVGAVQVGHSN